MRLFYRFWLKIGQYGLGFGVCIPPFGLLRLIFPDIAASACTYLEFKPMKKIAAITAAIVLAGTTAVQAQSLIATTTTATGSAAGIYPIIVAGTVLGTLVILDDSGTSSTN